jgi:hypothetical protein
MRQPEREPDEAAEGEEIVEREAPNLDVLQDRDLLAGRGRLAPLTTPRDLLGIFLGEQQKHDCHRQEGRRPDLRDSLPAHRHHHQGRHEIRDRRTNIAGAEYSEGYALPALRKKL